MGLKQVVVVELLLGGTGTLLREEFLQLGDVAGQLVFQFKCQHPHHGGHAQRREQRAEAFIARSDWGCGKAKCRHPGRKEKQSTSAISASFFPSSELLGNP